MFGLRSNCELIYAWIGAFAGFFTGALLLLHAPLPSITTVDGVRPALVLGVAAALFVCLIFALFYRQPFWSLFISVLIVSVLIGIVVYAIATLFTSSLWQPAILFLIGVLVGQLLGRLVCVYCSRDSIRPRPDISSRDEPGSSSGRK